MKVKFLPLIVVIILILTSINVIGINSYKENLNNISVKNDTIFFSQIKIDSKGEYVSINIEEANTALRDPGKPMLPVYVKTFKFPFGTKIIDIECIPSEVKQEVITSKIEPAPRPVPLISLRKSIYEDIEIVKENNEVYLSSELYPNNWYDYNIGCGLDGNERVIFVNVRCYPVQYSPNENTIYKIDSLDVKVSFEEGPNPLPARRKYDLVIITPRRFYFGALLLKIHKLMMGVSTKIKTTESIYWQYKGRDAPEKIKYFIFNAIEKWDVTHVLLLGGKQALGLKWFVPARYSNTFDRSYWNETSYVSDLYFSDIYRYNETTQEEEFEDWDSNGNGIFAEWTFIWDGVWWYDEDQKDILDLYPDVHVGRLACNHIKEVFTVVNKIRRYERPAFNKKWFKRMIVAGGDTVPFGDGIWEGEYENEHAASYMEPLGFEIDRYWASDGSLTNTSLIPGIRKGGGFLYVAGHGSPIVWATHWPESDYELDWIDALFTFDMGNLRNLRKLPVCVVGGCHNSMFDVAPIRFLKGLNELGIEFFNWTEDSECFGKWYWIPRCWSWNLVRQKWGGSIATIGNTGLGWGVSGESSIEVGDGFITTHFFQVYSEIYDLKDCSLGMVHSTTIKDYIDLFDPNNDEIDRKTVEQWVLLGDPSLKIGGWS
jgi:hypothetical protein